MEEDRPPAPLSVMALYRPEIPGAHDEVVHLALGDRVADLYGGGGRAFVQLFRREGRAVDAVLADTAAGHDDDVADLRFLLIALARLAVRGGLAGGHFGGDQADGAAIDQRLAEVALVEHDGAVDGGDAGLVAAVFHAFAHAFEDAAGMEQAGGQASSWKGEAKQNTSVLQMSSAPRPVPIGSRFTPTMPVSAPP